MIFSGVLIIDPRVPSSLESLFLSGGVLVFEKQLKDMSWPMSFILCRGIWGPLALFMADLHSYYYLFCVTVFFLFLVLCFSND